MPKNPETRTGDIFRLSEHRVVCINSCSRAATRILSKAGPVQLVFAGPPCFNQRGLGNWKSYSEYTRDMRIIMDNCASYLSDGGVFVWHVGNDSAAHHDHAGHHSRLLESVGLRYLDSIAWVKTTPNYGSPRNLQIQKTRRYYPAIQWEVLLVYQKPGNMPRMTREGMEYMTQHHANVWEIPAVVQQFERFGHPAVCPVEIPYRCLQAYTAPGDTVLDPFAGSGTSLIAAEQSGRKAVVLEVNPAFCDAILNRWADMTGMGIDRGRLDE